MTELTVLLLALLAAAGVAMVVAAERGQYTRAAAAGAAVVVAGWWLAVVAPLLTATLAAAAAVIGWVRFTRTQGTVSRWGARSRRKSGVARRVRRGCRTGAVRGAGCGCGGGWSVRGRRGGRPATSRWATFMRKDPKPTRPICRFGPNVIVGL